MQAVAALAALIALLAASPAGAEVGDWVDGGKARVRLLAAGADADGRLDAGIEIELAPGWHTYWRSPGDSGIAPVFDFSGSRNLGPVEVAYPPPLRYDDGFSVTNIYRGTVVLPLSAALGDPKAGGELAVKLDIGVCAEVCIPDHFEASLALAPAGADAAVAGTLKRARSLLPASGEPGVFAVEKLWRDGGSDKRPAFALSAKIPEAKDAEVFVEGPPDWYSDVPALAADEAGQAIFRFTFDRLGSKTPIAGAKLRVTVVSAGRAIEAWIGLD